MRLPARTSLLALTLVLPLSGFLLAGCWENWTGANEDNTDYGASGDADGDGIPDSVEGTGDSDGDGIPDYLDEDSDGDGIPDSVEGTNDSDGDGTPDYLDLDSDGDGIPDSIEGAGDADGDGIPNYLDEDSDGDGIPDSVEGSADSDGDGLADFLDTDSDNDGWTDGEEGTGDADGDGIPNYLDTDSDNDGIPDGTDTDVDGDGIPNDVEGSVDSDGDGTPDMFDEDSDNDGIPDAIEGAEDFDGDGIPNYLDDDSDGDGMPDSWEGWEDLDGDGQPNFLDPDSDGDGTPDSSDLDVDGDGISNEIEFGPDPTNPVDSDGDGVPDFYDSDSDGDGIPDLIEGTDDVDGDGIPNYLDDDSDGDGISDAWEGYEDLDGDGLPNFIDTDSDGDEIPDGVDTDTDGDGIPDSEEGTGDSDGDGIPDFMDTDSDNDGIPDDQEIINGTDPTNPDTDGDGWSDLQEDACESDPLDPLSVCDGQSIEIDGFDSTPITITYIPQVQMGDVMFILDETGSMQGTLDDVKDNFSDVVDEAGLLIPNLTFGVASYDDYNSGSMGGGSDRPYHHRQQQTTDTTLVQDKLDLLYASGGRDWPESTIEALYQAATGAGYDQNCDGNFDLDTDVLPFRSLDIDGDGTPDDPFAGAAGENYDSTVQGTGSLGGNGFREGAVPILVYATDATVRNATADNEGPGGCTGDLPGDAWMNLLFPALGPINAKAIGITARTTDAYSAMEQIAITTDSYVDLNFNGNPDPGEYLVYSSNSYNVVDQIMTGIEEFTTNVTYDLEPVADAPEGFVQTVNPSVINNAPPGVPVSFTVTVQPTEAEAATMFSDTVLIVPTTLYGDGAVVMAYWDLVFVFSSSP